MSVSDSIESPIDDRYSLIAASIKRGRSNDLTADVILHNGEVVYANRATLNTPSGRQQYAQEAGQAGGPSAQQIESVLLKSLYPDALATIQAQSQRGSQADALVDLIRNHLVSDASQERGIELFRDSTKGTYLSDSRQGHLATYRLSSKDVRHLLTQMCLDRFGSVPGNTALDGAIATLSGHALFQGAEREVFLRIGARGDTIYYDLGDHTWEVVEIDRDDWRILPVSPVRFVRSRGMLAQVAPIRGGSIKLLKSFLNLPDDPTAWIMLVAWIIAALRPKGPYPVWNLLGEQGSAKSTTQRMVRLIVDPYKAPIRSMPRNDQELMISAHNSWCQMFDNLSYLTSARSDALSRLSTGGGFATRELYADLEEVIIDAQRPIAINGIGEVAIRSDLLDRCVTSRLPAIPPEKRRPEDELLKEFEEARPAILGACFDAVSMALRNIESTRLRTYPRMADFARWIVAAEPALPWEPGAFEAAFAQNESDSNSLALEASVIGSALNTFLTVHENRWTGTATTLHKVLTDRSSFEETRRKEWPKSPKAMSDELRRIAPNLRKTGIEVAFSRTGSMRSIAFFPVGESASPASPASSAARTETASDRMMETVSPVDIANEWLA